MATGVTASESVTQAPRDAPSRSCRGLRLLLDRGVATLAGNLSEHVANHPVAPGPIRSAPTMAGTTAGAPSSCSIALRVWSIMFLTQLPRGRPGGQGSVTQFRPPVEVHDQQPGDDRRRQHHQTDDGFRSVTTPARSVLHGRPASRSDDSRRRSPSRTGHARSPGNSQLDVTTDTADRARAGTEGAGPDDAAAPGHCRRFQVENHVSI